LLSGIDVGTTPNFKLQFKGFKWLIWRKWKEQL
jgi:hypothetical protein